MSFNTIHNRNLVWNGTDWVPESQPGGGGGGAVTIADGADVAEGSVGDAAWSGSGNGTVVSVLKKIATGGSGGGPATIADGADVAEGAKADAAATDSTSSWTVVSILKGLWAKLAVLAAQVLDYDTGAGTASQVIVGIALPASGGPVAEG